MATPKADNFSEQSSAFEKWGPWLAAAAALFLTVHSLIEVWWLRPGWADVDEWAALDQIQRALDGGSLYLNFATGSLTRLLHYLSTFLPGPDLANLRLVPALFLLLENLLLFVLARRWFGTTAASGAVLANVFASFTLMRGRSLLCYGLLPAQLLTVFWLATRAGNSRGRWLLAGFAAVLPLLDYEAWFFAYPGMAAYLYFHLKPSRHNLGFGLAGMAAAAVLIVALSFDSFPTWIQARFHGAGAAAGTNLGSDYFWWHRVVDFFLGGRALAVASIPNHSVLPLWAWPLIGMGLVEAWKRARWVLVLVLSGMLPLLAFASAVEANREVVAWPGWCLLAGLGLARLQPASLQGWKRAALALWLVVGAWSETAIYHAFMRTFYSQGHGRSIATLAAAEFLNNQTPRKVLLYLEAGGQGHLNFVLDRKNWNSQGSVWAVVPWHAAPAWERSGGERLLEVRGVQGGRSILLGQVPPEIQQRFEDIDQALHRSVVEINPYDGLGLVRSLPAKIESMASADPWVVNALWTRWAHQAAQLKMLKADDFKRLQELSGLRAEPFHYPGLYVMLYDPRLGTDMLAEAVRRDPRIASRLKSVPEYMRRLGVSIDAETLQKLEQLKKHAPKR